MTKVASPVGVEGRGGGAEMEESVMVFGGKTAIHQKIIPIHNLTLKYRGLNSLKFKTNDTKLLEESMGELSSFVYVFTLKERTVFLSMILKKMRITQPQSNREGWVMRGGMSSEVTSAQAAVINTPELSLGQKVKN